jgi:Sec-independent protein translocase protein TatA
MESFFGIGLPEFILIMIIAGIVMGPERIAKTARWLGKTSAQLQAISRGFVRQFYAEVEAVDQGGEIKGAMREMQELQRQVAELKTELKTVTQSAMRDSRQTIEAARIEAEQTIRPLSFPSLNEPVNGQSTAKTERQPSASQPLPKRVDVENDPD